MTTHTQTVELANSVVAALQTGFDLAPRFDGGHRSVEAYPRQIATAIIAELVEADIEYGWSLASADDDLPAGYGWITVYPTQAPSTTRYTLRLTVELPTDDYTAADICRRVSAALRRVPGDCDLELTETTTI